jgi:hypothetical protein
MPAPFAQITRAEFDELLQRFPFTRHVNAVHMHHTWRPTHAQYRGHDTIVSMWRHHTQTNGWSDIAQHITIAPDGSIWLGRNWNRPPASAAGHNGNSVAGPFMFEIIGDFDTGQDRFQDAQRETVLQVIAAVQKRFGLAPETLMFHNMMSSKTCPGSAIAYETCLEEVQKRLAGPVRGARSRARAVTARDLPFAQSLEAPVERMRRAIALLTRELPATRGEEADAEHEDQTPLELERRSRGGAEIRAGITAEMLAALRPHVVNLRGGQFSRDGLMTTSPEDVDALFADALPRALRAAKAQGTKLRLLIFAHGGLVSESAGLQIAHKHLAWWSANGVYPINIVWETGLGETVADLLRKTQQQGERSILSDFVTDPIIEAALRVLPMQTVWSGMKRAAEQAVAAEGGARHVAEKLRAFTDAHKADVELHAVGHSAGAVFHSHFLAACRALKVPSFRSAHFLAPAVRVDTFVERLGALLGPAKGVDHLTVFTMTKAFERDDHCAHIYRKSLLYLVSASAEAERDALILGLEESLRASAECRALLGLSGNPSALGEVVWSKTDHDDGRSASRSTSHGGFDDDPTTLGSVVRRVLGKADADPVVPYAPLAATGARGADWAAQIDWPEPLRTVRPRPAPHRAGFGAAAPETRAATAGGSGRRRALCIGIDDYRIRPLAGCVADAELWAQTLTAIGFEPPRMLLNGAATRTAIVQAMDDIVGSAEPGDIVVIQFAGHGTRLPDVDRDEPDSEDEALCPIDFPDGAFLLDDDIAGICSRIPDGVNVTFFTDCCHSGTVTRLGLGAAAGPGGDERARFVPADESMKAAHVRYRAQLQASRAAPPPRTAQREVLFSACRSDEVAWETNGQGEFTVRATGIVRQGGEGLTHEAFHAQVIRAFGAQPRQHPELHCAPEATGRALLGAVSAPLAAVAAPSGGRDDLVTELTALLKRYGGPAAGA